MALTLTPPNEKSTPSCENLLKPWFRDTESCTGTFDYETRKRRICEFAALDEQTKAIKVHVPLEPGHCSEQKQQQQDGETDGEKKFRHFQAFGFLSSEPFMMPGTPILFVAAMPSHQEEQTETLKEGKEVVLRRAVVSAMYVAKGQRPGDYSIVISFKEPVLERDVSALFKDTMLINELETKPVLCDSLQKLVWYNQEVAGDTEPSVMGRDAMLNTPLDLWANEMQKKEDVSNEALQREDHRCMADYAKALGAQQALAPTKMVHAKGRQRIEDAIADFEKGALSRDPEDDGTIFTEPEDVARTHVKRRRHAIVHAHERYMVGMICCMGQNPIGMRQFIMQYEDHMRIRGGAELAQR